MQLAVIEFARNVCGLRKAPVIEEKKMRLGAYKCKIMPKTISYRAYKNSNPKIQRPFTIFERHRHSCELNNAFRDKLESKGMIMAGINPKNDLVEIIEVSDHPFFVGTQFHPEFKSRPLRPHPLFREFIKAGIKVQH